MPVSGAVCRKVAATQAQKLTKVPMERSRSLTAMISICAMVASAIGTARLKSRLSPV
jgi:hypothetical protein